MARFAHHLRRGFFLIFVAFCFELWVVIFDMFFDTDLVFSYRVSGAYTLYRLHVSEPGPWILHITFDNCGGLFAQLYL